MPSIFTGQSIPSYLSEVEVKQRSEGTSFSARFDKQYQKVEAEAEAESFLQTLSISSLQDIKEKEPDCLIPGVIARYSDTQINFIGLETGIDLIPEVAYSLSIDSALDFTMAVRGVTIKKLNISHIVTSDKLTSTSHVCNILSYLKTLSEREEVPVADALTQCLELLSKVKTEDDDVQKKISFLYDQLSLCDKKPTQRRYSPVMLATAAMWENCSTALYKKMRQEGNLTLPSVGYLKNLSNSLNVDTGMNASTKAYLKARFERLTSNKDKNISIIIDEVYSAQQVELMNGKIVGNETKEPTKTLLSFMIKSVCGQYQDMVAMVPVVRLDAELVNTYYKQVLQVVTDIGFETVTTLMDGHSINRRFYQILCGGVLKPYIENPYKKGSKIFLLYDSVHIFKNLYTNFLRKRKFTCPDFQGEKISADWSHLEQLYKLELDKPLRIAHKLSDKVLRPKPIERTNVKLSDNLFHESTIDALNYYSAQPGKEKWKETASFLKVVRVWWNILNVKTPMVGYHKRDHMRDPIRKEDCAQLRYLKEFSEWLVKWEKTAPKSESLSKETFFCSKQTSSAICALACYLINDIGLKYVCLGKISSDPIERRFGRYRQLSGANYFISVKQFLEAEKTIRLDCLVRFSKLEMKEIKSLFLEAENEKEEKLDSETLVLIDTLESDMSDPELSDADSNVLYFVSGYISRGLLSKLKCTYCSELIAKSKNVPEIRFIGECSESSLTCYSQLLNAINRGGLVTPSDMIFLATVQCWKLYSKILENSEAKDIFLSVSNQKKVFSALYCDFMLSSPEFISLCQSKCINGHDFKTHFKHISTVLFNCMCKNLMGTMNDKIHQARKRASKEEKAERKIAKLSSEK